MLKKILSLLLVLLVTLALLTCVAYSYETVWEYGININKSSDQLYSVTVTKTNSLPREYSAKLLVARYNNKNMLNKINVYDVPSNLSLNEKSVISFDNYTYINGEYFKILIVDNSKNLRPVGLGYNTLLTLNEEMKAINDMNTLNYSDISNEPSNAIITSFALPGYGVSGTPITWVSDNENVITNIGRVIRARNDTSSQTATLTADFGFNIKKTFTFTVLSDEPFVDPQYMTDAEFFGKWANNRWEIEGKFDYTKTELAKVEQAAKEGSYANAKVELLNYMRNRVIQTPYKLPSRSTGWSNMVVSNIFTTQADKYYQGECVASSNEYQTITIPVATGNIAKGGSTTYGIIARYNENSEALIASKQNLNETLRPKIQLIVNGQTRIIDVDVDSSVRTGNYKNVNYGLEQDLKVKMFGDFLGDETYKALIRFNFAELIDTDKITSAKLIFNVKVNPKDAITKSLIVLLEPTNIWNEQSIVYNTLIGYVYNFNGIKGGNDWETIKGSDAAYVNQAARFLEADEVAAEYKYTNNEKYAYAIISRIMDFIKDKGGPIVYGTEGAWPPGVPIRGGYPGTLHSGLRVNTWNTGLLALIKSQYMTPEVYTAILKGIWDTTDNLQLSLTANNARQSDMMNIFMSALNYPEFKNRETWLNFSEQEMEEYLYYNNFPDGSYKEPTGNYNILVFQKFIDYKKLMISYGQNVSAAFDDMMQKSAYYNSLLRAPNGSNLQYGDEGAGQNTNQRYAEIVTWYGDTDLEFIDSLGKKGTMPKWTSRQFPDSALTFMRSDWTTRALFIFTQVRGGGTHGDNDDNSITLFAYDRLLLNDAGIFTYTAGDPYKIWGSSSIAHNTVTINNTSSSNGAVGTINNWVTTNKFDFLSQTTNAYLGPYGYHKRTITFLKPYFWIVSDLMTPNNMTVTNNYKQIWHMLPTANLKTDQQNKIISSNYSSGANIILTSPDKGIGLAEADGWYDYNYQQLAPAKYAYFEKSGKGTTNIDCVIMPYESTASVDAQRIDTGVDTTIATAMKFKTIVGSIENMNYYLLDNEYNANNYRTFDKYKTNSKMALITENTDGSWKEIIMVGGNSLMLADGTEIVHLNSTISDISFEISGTSIIIHTSQENPDFSNVVLTTNSNIENVKINDTLLQFTKNNDKIILQNPIVQ